MTTEASIEIGSDLRRILRVARTSPDRWGGRKLTQEEVAHHAGISPTWYRNLETGYADSASVSVVADICQYLEIDPDFLEPLGYIPVVEELRTRFALGNKVTLDLDRLKVLTKKEEETLRPILDKLAAAPAKKREVA